MKIFKNKKSSFIAIIALYLGGWLLVSEAVAKEDAKVIPYKYTELAVEDISYKGVPRLVVRIQLDTEEKPTKERMVKTAKKIWSAQQREWKEFTVFMIYGEMENFNYGAYGAAEFRPKGLLEFKTYEDNYQLWKM
ncbi:MAG: hypothetical protein ACSHX0_12295 [Akkermansiaceae bacterium]